MKMAYQLTLFNWGSFPAPHFIIRGIPSPLRPPFRHSGEGRNPEGGGVRRPDDEKTARRITIFILLCGLHKPMVIPSKAGIQKGWGAAKRPDDQKDARRTAIFILLCGLRKATVITGKAPAGA